MRYVIPMPFDYAALRPPHDGGRRHLWTEVVPFTGVFLRFWFYLSHSYVKSKLNPNEMKGVLKQLAIYVEDIAGGLMVTMPSEKDFKSDLVVGKNNETIGDICNKYFAASPS